MAEEGYSGKDLVEAINKIKLEEKLERIYFFVRVDKKDKENIEYKLKYIKIRENSRSYFNYIEDKIKKKLGNETIINECADFALKKPCYIDFSLDPQKQVTVQAQSHTYQSGKSDNVIATLIEIMMEGDPPTNVKYSPKDDYQNTDYIGFKLGDESGNYILIFDKFDKNTFLKRPKHNILRFSNDDTYEIVSSTDYIILRKKILFVYYKDKIIIFALSEFERDSKFKEYLKDYHIKKLKNNPNYKELNNIIDDPQSFEKNLRNVDPSHLRNLNKVVRYGIKEVENELNNNPKIVENIKKEYKRKTQKELKVEFDEQSKKFVVGNSNIVDLIKIITDRLAETFIRRRVVEVQE
ncbi:hypothetical protein STK_13050 [Sulfurisphaera tokodaii str. 7]|uniref:Uncharacterized protein n=1 Tax=Sulfurisphaera tokodaii (strain DSM 16993 / JCM 10545 / NBRC 100140 / 7) TaxID=273063 RepID=Q971R7_SULTO|nr:hypothetical protein [Sulfurisphaera tokodaii]BAB66353.1 hypothetical protein STK_13050 [Sulfurisphaera tokodaii str. 7]